HPELRWKNRIHEVIDPALIARGVRLVWTDISIHHTGYQDPVVRARKNERDLRLLLMDLADGTDKPSTFLYIGKHYLAMGRATDAVSMLQQGLERSKPSDQSLPAFYRVIVECHRSLRHWKEALSACAAGRAHHPLDAGLCWQEGQIREETGDDTRAERCYLQLLQELDRDEL